MNGVGVHGWTSSESEDRSVDIFPTVVRETHTAYVAMVGHGVLLADGIFCLPDDARIVDCLAVDDRLRHTQGAAGARSEERGHVRLAPRYLRADRLPPGSPP
ncbi:hypothetical protein [Rhodococcus sp. ACS1]|uniref:hypothetical protein n=1 Tax=Rhodococcus sp. ACS1 TaxID=2028570 RepID=UPI000AB31962|nr:hypothetical protein [Rhodococcus sp. ACS1]